MRNKIAAFLREQDLLRPGDTVVCALSGGADSVAMSHALLCLKDEWQLNLKACHFNHSLRKEADGDEEFCRELCEKWGIPFFTEKCDVRREAEKSGESIEEAARRLRYDFFSRMEGLVATAHTADDQVETVLMQMLRGTGLKGLCGVPPKRGKIIRPLITVSREEVLAYLKENDLPHREDATNAEDDCLRNRLRHHIVPLLKEENPALCRTVERMTGYLREDEAFLQKEADALLQKEKGGYALSPLRTAPEALRRRALKSLLSSLPVPKLSANHILAAEELIFSTDGTKTVDFPDGKQLRRSYDILYLEGSSTPPTFEPVTLRAPGKVKLDGTPYFVNLREGSFPGLHFTQAQMENGITVRPRRTGDSLRLPGGSKSLKKLFIDRQIPANLRECIPVIADAAGVLAVWAVGAAPAPESGAEKIYTLTVENEKGEWFSL